MKKRSYFIEALSIAQKEVSNQVELGSYSISSSEASLTFNDTQKESDNSIDFYFEKKNDLWSLKEKAIKTIKSNSSSKKKKKSFIKKHLSKLSGILIIIPFSIVCFLIWLLIDGKYFEYMGYFGVFLIIILVIFSISIIRKVKHSISNSEQLQVAMSFIKKKEEIIELIGSDIKFDKNSSMSLNTVGDFSHLKIRVAGSLGKRVMEFEMNKDEELNWKVIDLRY
jgi:hypothetical protein